MIYVPKHAEAEVRRRINNYAKLKKTMDEMSDANIRLLTKSKPKNVKKKDTKNG